MAIFVNLLSPGMQVLCTLPYMDFDPCPLLCICHVPEQQLLPTCHLWLRRPGFVLPSGCGLCVALPLSEVSPSHLHQAYSFSLKIQLRYRSAEKLNCQSLAFRLLDILDLRVLKQSLCMFPYGHVHLEHGLSSVPFVSLMAISELGTVYVLRNDCWLAGWSLRAGSIETLSHTGLGSAAREGVARPVLLEDGMRAVRVHLKLLAGLSKCIVKARPGEAVADHEQLLREVH